MVTVKCEACGKFLEIPEEYRGTTGKCNACGAALLVPKSDVKPVPKWKIGCLFAFCGFMIIGYVGDMLTPNQPVAAKPAPVAASAAKAPPVPARPAPVLTEPVPDPEPELSSAQFEQIREYMNNSTSLQWEEYKKTIIGKRVNWEGWVVNSKQKILGGYEVQADMDPPGTPLSAQDIYIEVPESVARGLSVGQKIKFTGTVESITYVLGACGINIIDATVN